MMLSTLREAFLLCLPCFSWSSSPLSLFLSLSLSLSLSFSLSPGPDYPGLSVLTSNHNRSTIWVYCIYLVVGTEVPRARACATYARRCPPRRSTCFHAGDLLVGGLRCPATPAGNLPITPGLTAFQIVSLSVSNTLTPLGERASAGNGATDLQILKPAEK
ncbi:hypothetical protein IWZ03DRAFT_245534 [Phyllosticta citriasiana]|uniref:Secreted protein n=1 Tax=Phyllosticta citriasiana TaxID=595635 RepID=A0ABR1KI78_9PEZI